MKHLAIHDFGPIKSADIDFKQINLIIGPQSAGKSCILKIASFCAWLEKRIEIEQSEKRFKDGGTFLNMLVSFHKLQGFEKPDTCIAYETDYMNFSYSHAERNFSFRWKEERWAFKRNKIAYIPAERNLVAAIPNWYEVKFEDNNIREFMADWENARKYFAEKGVKVLDLGVSYYYDSPSKGDKVQVAKNVTLNLTNASSGLQSLIPLFIQLQYLTKNIDKEDSAESVVDQSENKALLMHIHQELFAKNIADDFDTAYIGGKLLHFANFVDAEDCKRIYSNFTKAQYSDIFLEEPEENLFPLTQFSLVNWLAELVNGPRKHNLFIATHSPYIMTSFNNLIQAGDVLQEIPSQQEKVYEIVSKQKILYYENVSAYALKDGCAHSIMDDEMKLISPEELDSASDEISTQFGKLLDL